MTKDGEFVKARFGSRFMFSVENKDLILSPGEYILMVDPIWDKSAEFDSAYKDVLIDIYSNQATTLVPIDDMYGFNILCESLKDAASRLIPKDERKFCWLDKPEYKDCYRITAIEGIDCWYGFIYTQNDSDFNMRESVTPELEGLEIAWPFGKQSGETIEIDMGPQESHIIVLRRVDNKCRYGLGYVTHPRELSDTELV